MEGHKPKIPRVVAGIAMHTLPLSPMEGFVLSRIDAISTLGDIADLTSLDVSEVARIVEKLLDLGAVEWADGTVHLPRMSAKSVAPPRPTMARPSQIPPNKVAEIHSSAPPKDAAFIRVFSAPAPKVPQLEIAPPSPPPTEIPAAVITSVAPAAAAPAAPAGPPTDGIELPMDRRKRIDDLYVAIDLLDHYAVLGISRKAAKNDVRSAYFELSKAFHPDTAFRKNVGNYRHKMETIFKRLTEAYEVLGKKKTREEYDSYLLSIGETREVEQTLSSEHEIPEELRAPAVPAAPPPPAPLPATPPPAPLPARSTPTEEGKRVARELLQKRLGNARTTASHAVVPPSPEPPPGPAHERTRQDMIRDLAGTLKATATHTGGLDRVVRLMADAHKAEATGDLAAAVKAYRLALALAPDRLDIAEDHERVAKELAISLASQYEAQAIYEEKTQKWATAATNWGKVVEGRPDDLRALTRAAITLIEAKGDLHLARKFAQRAVEVAPDDASAHFALGRVFHAAGLALNAKRELEIVKRIDPGHAAAQALLRSIAQSG